MIRDIILPSAIYDLREGDTDLSLIPVPNAALYSGIISSPRKPSPSTMTYATASSPTTISPRGTTVRTSKSPTAPENEVNDPASGSAVTENLWSAAFTSYLRVSLERILPQNGSSYITGRLTATEYTGPSIIHFPYRSLNRQSSLQES